MIRASMIPFSSVYRRGIGIGLSDMLAYRGSFFVQFFFQLFPLVTAIYLWRAVYHSGGAAMAAGGYDEHTMLSYFVLMNMIRLATFVEDMQWTLPQQIRKGELNKYLVRPVDFVMMEWHMRMGQALMAFILLLIPAGLVFWFARAIMIVPAESWRWGAFFLSIFLGLQIGFLVSICVGFTAFWVLEHSSLQYAIFPIQMLRAGGWFPLEMLPAKVFAVVSRLPWAYETYLPMRIYLGRLDAAGALAGLAGQGVWVALLAALSYGLWRRGLKRYAAVGG